VSAADTTLHLPAELRARLDAELARWDAEERVARLWRRDPTLWTARGEERWLGWLDVGERTLAEAPAIARFAGEVRDQGLTQVLLLGMGGSSLCPEVLARTFGPRPGWPELRVLDSTNPDQIRRFESALDLRRTLVVVASKSGTTLEPSLLLAHFEARLAEALGGARRAGGQLVAITDPGSQLAAHAEGAGFRQVFLGDPAVGGRFSALSVFGMVPAALLGLDLERLLGAAGAMARRCREPRAAENPGVLLGLVAGLAAAAARPPLAGAATPLRDKLTLLLPPEICELGGWLEQLVAESTGKDGVAVLPIDGEPLAAPTTYGDDRLFVVVHLGPDDRRLTPHARALAAAGAPVVELTMDGVDALGAEFFRWEVATAVAGAVLGVNPFDQPDVEAAKVASRALTAEYERSGALPAEAELHREGDVALHTDLANDAALRAALGAEAPTLAGLLRAHLARAGSGDYLALLAFTDLRREHREPLQRIRRTLLERRGVATTLGFGPRYLHSTGQAHKGGPPSGVFLVITAAPRQDLPVPGSRLTFGTVLRAQAGGDLAVLLARGRRALRVHLDGDSEAGLRRLADIVESAVPRR
jgi:glucose-6-phosphate isomerase